MIIRLKDLLLEALEDFRIYDQSGSSTHLEFTQAAREIDREIDALKRKKQDLANLKKVASKLYTRWKRVDDLSRKQMETPKWDKFSKDVDRDSEWLADKLKEVGFTGVDLDWRWDGVK